MSLSANAFLEAADRIGNRLCRDAIWAGDRCNWLGWSFVPQHAASVPGYRAQGVALHDGVAGIALFLAWLSRFTGDSLHTRTLHGALRQLDRASARLLADLDPRPDGRHSHGARPHARSAAHAIGLHAGAAGVAAACLQLGDLLYDEAWLMRGRLLLESLALYVDRTKDRANALDVMHGEAGAIPVLLQGAARFGLPELREAARRLGDTLLDAAIRTDQGCAWPSRDAGVARPFLGYAHGAGGIACALLELHHATADDRYRTVASMALQEKRRLSVPLDSFGWCDGAASVACTLWRASELLARIPAIDVVPDSRDASADARIDAEPDADADTDAAAEAGVFAEARAGADAEAAALHATVEAELIAILHALADRLADARPWTHSFCLYHGLAGCADVLLAAGEQLGRPAFHGAAEALGEDGLVHFHRSRVPWPCGIPGIGQSPNLFLGLAGIGYFYMRLYRPRMVPTQLVVRGVAQPSGSVADTDRLSPDRLSLDALEEFEAERTAVPEAP